MEIGYNPTKSCIFIYQQLLFDLRTKTYEINTMISQFLCKSKKNILAFVDPLIIESHWNSTDINSIKQLGPLRQKQLFWFTDH